MSEESHVKMGKLSTYLIIWIKSNFNNTLSLSLFHYGLQ